jgi:hypothetical protein
MHERDDAPQFRPSDEGHNHWLAMQSAYAEYQRASEALQPADELADEQLPFPTLEDRQRHAFERYMESRMEFLECRFDQSNPPGALPAAPPWRAFVPRGPVLPILAAFLVCTVGFAWIRERRQVRALEASRDELRAELSQTRTGLRMLAEKMDAWTPPIIQPVAQIPAAPPVRSAAPRAATVKQHAPVRRKRQPGEGVPKNGSASRSMRARVYPERPRFHNPT